MNDFTQNLDAFALAVDEIQTTSAQLSALAVTAAQLVNEQAKTDLAGAKIRAAEAEKMLAQAQDEMHRRFQSAAKTYLGKKPHWLESKQKFFERVAGMGYDRLVAAFNQQQRSRS